YGQSIISQDGDTVAVTILDVATGDTTVIDKVMYSETEPTFTPDGQSVIYYDASWANDPKDRWKPIQSLWKNSLQGNAKQRLAAITAPGSDYAGTIACNPVTGQIAYYDDDSIFVIPANGGIRQLVSAGLS